MAVTKRSAIRLVALDLDGTVFNSQKQISPRTLAALRAALEQGVAVVPATGRPLVGVPLQFTGLPGVRYALTSNGGCVWQLQPRRALARLTMTPAQAQKALRILEPFDCMADVYADGQAWATHERLAQAARFTPPEMLPYVLASRQAVEDMPAFVAGCPGVEKLSILFTSPGQRAAARRALAEAGFTVTHSIATNLEVNAPGVHKGAGLLALAPALGIPRECVMACGDSANDVEMLRAAGLGIAMGNAEPEVLGAARAVTLSNDEDGVAAALERYVLGCPADR